MKWFKRADVAALQERVEKLECEDHDWEYVCDIYLFSIIRQPYKKTCKLCGKEIVMEYEHWLQEQADTHYKKHCECIDGLNKLNEEE